MSVFPLYLQIEPTAQPTTDSNMCDLLKSSLDVQQFKPVRLLSIISKEMMDGSGHHYILKNSECHSYVRLSPQEFWIWEQMNGEKSIRQLVLSYFTQYEAFAFGAIVSLVDRLREGNMLTERPCHLYADVSTEIKEQSLFYKMTWIARMVFTREFVIRNLDSRLNLIYKYGGWLFFTGPAQLLFLLITIIGLYLFVFLARDPQYNLLNLNAALQLGLVAYIPLLIHEFGHAITAKHFGCEVYKGGVMLYYGMPAVFVDTTDVWMYSKRARLSVTWAGPYTGYIIGGGCAIAVYFLPNLSYATQVFLLQVALTSIFTTSLNILPLLKLDGYYLLADALEIPRLRERSMEFITRHMLGKIASREKWSRNEWIFLIFGILAFLSTFYFTYTGAIFWYQQATKSISELFYLQGDFSAILKNIFIFLLALSSIIYSLIFLTSSAKRIVQWLQKKRLLSTRFAWN